MYAVFLTNETHRETLQQMTDNQLLLLLLQGHQILAWFTTRLLHGKTR